MKVSLITELPQRFRRLFRTTTPKSSNVGRPGFEQRENWQRFFDKYRAPCIEFVEHKYPFCKPDSEDVFMRVAERIMANPSVTNRKPGDTFRTVLCNLCIREIFRMHHPKRQEAERRFNRQPVFVTVPHLFHRKSIRRTRLEEIALFVEADLRSPEYVNGMYYEPIDEDKLSLWCQIQSLKADCPKMTYGEAAERLGLSRWTVYRALQTLHRHIRRETYRIAASLDYL